MIQQIQFNNILCIPVLSGSHFYSAKTLFNSLAVDPSSSYLHMDRYMFFSPFEPDVPDAFLAVR